jgi:hypothetical protein
LINQATVASHSIEQAFHFWAAPRQSGWAVEDDAPLGQTQRVVYDHGIIGSR